MIRSIISFLCKSSPFWAVIILWRLQLHFWNPGGILAIIPIFFYFFVMFVTGIYNKDTHTNIHIQRNNIVQEIFIIIKTNNDIPKNIINGTMAFLSARCKSKKYWNPFIAYVMKYIVVQNNFVSQE